MADALVATELGVRLGSQALLDRVSFEAGYGTLLAIVGPNGAGKSTLVRAVLGLLRYTGRVSVGGVELSALTPIERARTIAYVPQRSTLTTGVSVADIVAQARYAHRSRFGRTDPSDASIASALEHTGLETLSRRAYDTLSGGEQRRVLLARALATGGRVLVLDEPTAGLDVAHVLRFFSLVQRLKSEGFAVVSVLHDLADARRHADRVLLLSAGRAIALGTSTDVLSAENIAKVYGVQSHERSALGFSLDGESP